eukprot:gene29876-37275_t
MESTFPRPSTSPVELLNRLNNEYTARSHKRKSYLQLLGFIGFVVLYFSILVLQTSPFEEFRVREGLTESLSPKDENGEVIPFFTNVNDIYDWIKEIIAQAWTEEFCGNDVCSSPVEFPAFSYHGCLADCGQANTTLFVIALEARFRPSGDEAQIAELLANVKYNLCTDDLVPLCWWEEDQTFAENEVTVRTEVGLPDAVWTLRITGTHTSTGMVVGGIRQKNET